MKREVPPARAPPVLVHLPRRQRGVAIHRLQVVREVAVGVVQELAAQIDSTGPSACTDS